MICPKCKVRMKCFDTANDNKKMQTARRYKCPECLKIIWTMERPYDRDKVNYILSFKNGRIRE